MSADRRPSVDTILTGIIEQRLAGNSPDVDAILGEYPDLADELRARLSDLEQLEGLWDTAPPSGQTPGEKLGEFEVERELGRGGMGVVYLARQAALNRSVALKVIPKVASLSQITRKRFLREAEAMAALSHPNIVPVFAAGETDDVLYIAMEHVNGPSLAEVLDRVRGDRRADGVPALDKEYLELTLKTIVGVASALHFAHERGIIHRDVKPSNILLDQDQRPRLLDFGLAAINSQPHVTVSGEFFGTPHYVSPEQARAQHDQIDRRTDVYSLGATLYECLTLSPPHDAPSVSEVLDLVLNAEPHQARRVNPSVPPDLNTVVMTALARRPPDRYATAEALGADIERFLGFQPILARPPGIGVRTARYFRRNPAHAVILGIVILMGVLGTMGYWSLGRYQGQIEADEQYEVGKAYRFGGPLEGSTVARDPRRALLAFEGAAALGHTGAMRELSAMYLTGVGCDRDPEQAAEIARNGMRLGSTECAVAYARILLESNDRAAEARDILARAVEENSAEAMSVFGEDLLISRPGMPAERSRALELLNRAVDLGETWALHTLGRAHHELSDGAPDYDTARRYYEQARATGNPMATVRLAWLYLDGKLGRPDPARAVELFREATDRGDSGARRELARLLLTGQVGVPADRDEALRLLTEVADTDPDAQLLLGRAHDDLCTGEPDFETARRWYEESRAAGNTRATVQLAWLYLDGFSGPRDPATAQDLLREASNLGDRVATCELAELLLTGDEGVPADREAALRLLNAIADHDCFAALLVGRAHDDLSAGEPDYREARDWYRKASALGSFEATSKVARMYWDGIGGPADEEAAVRVLTEASRGNPSFLNELGMLYLERGTEPASRRAIELFEQAANQGDSLSMTALGNMHLMGIGIPPSYGKALEWFQIAVEAGDTLSLVGLANMYDNGLGVEKDPAKATEFFRSAADRGLPQALVIYGQRLEFGVGLPEPDLIAARNCYERAAMAGDRNGMELLARCLEQGIGGPIDPQGAAFWKTEARGP